MGKTGPGLLANTCSEEAQCTGVLTDAVIIFGAGDRQTTTDVQQQAELEG